MNLPSLRTCCLAAPLTLVLLASLSTPAAASQCAEDLVLLEPTNIEVVVTPPQACLTVEVIASGCGDTIAVRVDNQCSEPAFVVGGDPSCTAEAPCEAAPGQRVFVYIPETSGHVEVTFSVSVGADTSEVGASFDISEDVGTPGEADGEGCSTSGAGRAGGGSGAVLAFAMLFGAYARRRR